MHASFAANSASTSVHALFFMKAESGYGTYIQAVGGSKRREYSHVRPGQSLDRICRVLSRLSDSSCQVSRGWRHRFWKWLLWTTLNFQKNTYGRLKLYYRCLR